MDLRYAVCLLFVNFASVARAKSAIYIDNTHNIHKVSNMAGLYVSKITKAGQVSIPKELRAELNLGEADYVSMEPRRDIVILKKVRSLGNSFRYFEEEGKRKGITRADVDKAIHDVRSELMKERYNI